MRRYCLIDKIEVYVRMGKRIGGKCTSEPIPDGVIKHAAFIEFGLDSNFLPKSMLKHEMAMSDEDREALRVVNEFADKEGLRVEVHDVSKLMERLKAARFRIGKTPVVVLGKNRFEGELKPEQLTSVLGASVE